MPTLNAIQTSFAAGELAPLAYGRVDVAKFHVGARTMLNFFVHPQGGASNRPGTRFCGEVDDSTALHRLIPFSFRTLPAGQSYWLVFGHKTMQVGMNNGAGSIGFVQSGGANYTIATPYAASDLALLKFVQSADSMTICHPNYAVRKLTRTGHTNWQLAPITFQPSTPSPTGLAAGSGGSAVFIQVTAINDGTGEESLPCTGVGSASGTDTWTWTAVARCSNYNVYKQKGSIYGFVAQVQTNSWTDASIAPNIGNTPPGSRTPFGVGIFQNLTIGAGGSGYASPTGKLIDGVRQVTTITFGLSGGAIVSATPAATGQSISAAARVVITDGSGSGAVLTPIFGPIDPNTGYYTLTGVAVTNGGSGYSANVQVGYTDGGVGVGNPVFAATIAGGVITSVNIVGGSYMTGDSSGFAFVITDSAGSGAVITPNITADGGNQNPFCTSYYQQRQSFGGTLGFPQTLWLTGVGAFNNMNVSTPTKDSDAITRALTGTRVDEIRHMIPVGTSMMILTAGGEWRCWPGPASQALTPGSCFTLPQTDHGSSHCPPLWTQNTLLMFKERGASLIALEYNVLQDIYDSEDYGILAQHMFTDVAGSFAITARAWADAPFKILWCVRSDGALLGFTFMKKQEIWAWHRHTTLGSVESICSIVEPDGFGGYEDAVYLIVKRQIGGQTKRYVERMVSRSFPTIQKAWFLDCALQYSGAPVSAVQAPHLPNMTGLSALCDGSVLQNLSSDANGNVTLDGAYSTVTLGLPYTSTLETLNLELPAGGTVQGQMKKIAKVTVRLKDTRGLSVGIDQMNFETGAETSPAIVEMKQRTPDQFLGTAMQPFNGDKEITVAAEWALDGRLVAQQTYPLPCTILALIPTVEAGR